MGSFRVLGESGQDKFLGKYLVVTAERFNLAVLMACHNRRDTTLSCLSRLFQYLNKSRAELEFNFSVFLVDDGSTDGTADAVRESYASVNLIRGDGSLYWNQGMRLAWDNAAGGDFDGFLWLNDDTMLFPGAITCLLQTLWDQEKKAGQRGIVVGSCQAPQDDSDIEESSSTKSLVTYGGRDQKGLVYPEDQPIPVPAFNGNLVLVSREAFSTLGNLSNSYRHSFGDIEYGIRARKAGVPIWLTPGFLAECPRNPPPKWLDSNSSFLDRWRAARSPKGWSVSEIKAFSKVRGQRWWILSLARQIISVCFPGYARKYQSRFKIHEQPSCNTPRPDRF